MCDVPSTAVFCRDSVERFPGIFSGYIFSLLVTILAAPLITGMTENFIFHVHYYHHRRRRRPHHHLLITGFLSPGTSPLEPVVHPTTQS
jgi:hypothetical protein